MVEFSVAGLSVPTGLTVNYGLSWVYEPHNLNYDLTKPPVLARLVGQGGLAPETDGRRNFAPSAGLAWSPGHATKTVVRAGAGLYYDALFGNSTDIDSERPASCCSTTNRKKPDPFYSRAYGIHSPLSYSSRARSGWPGVLITEPLPQLAR